MRQPKGTDWLMDTKKRSVYMLSTRDPLQTQGHIQTESEKMEKDIPSKWKSNESWRSNSHIRKTDFKIKTITRDKEGHYIIIKGSFQEEDITSVYIYEPKIGASQYIRQMLTAIKGEIDRNTIIVGDFNTPLSPMDRSSKMKINKETQALSDTLNKMDLIDTYRTFHPKTTECTFFSSAHGTFQDRSYLGSQNKPW